MKYQIVCMEYDNEIAYYSSESIPNIRDYLHFPHKGLYRVKDIVRYISDDCTDFENAMMHVTLCVTRSKDKLFKSEKESLYT